MATFVTARRAFHGLVKFAKFWTLIKPTIIHAIPEGVHLRLVEVVRLQFPVQLLLLLHDLRQHLFVFFGALDSRRPVLAMLVLGDDEGQGNAGTPCTSRTPYPVGV